MAALSVKDVVGECFQLLPMGCWSPRESAGEILELTAWLERVAKCERLLHAVVLAGCICYMSTWKYLPEACDVFFQL